MAAVSFDMAQACRVRLTQRVQDSRDGIQDSPMVMSCTDAQSTMRLRISNDRNRRNHEDDVNCVAKYCYITMMC